MLSYFSPLVPLPPPPLPSLGAGRSGSLFLASSDDTMLFKTLSKDDVVTLMAVLKDYATHVCTRPSRLMKFFALHKIKFRSTGETRFLVVAPNIFHLPQNLVVEHKFDLKGRKPKKPPHRRMQDANKGVWKDNQLARVFPVHERVHQHIIDCIKGDVEFLRAHDMMDYSLLIGVAQLGNANISDLFPPDYSYRLIQPGVALPVPSDPRHKEVLTIGIIDFLSRYQTWKKKTAHFFKSFLWPDDQLSTVNSGYYAERFLDFTTNTVFPHPRALIVDQANPENGSAEALSSLAMNGHLTPTTQAAAGVVVVPQGVPMSPRVPTLVARNPGAAARASIH